MSVKLPTVDTPQFKDLARNWAMVEIDPVNNLEQASIPWRWQELVAHVDGAHAATTQKLLSATQRADGLAAEVIVLNEQLQAARADAERFSWALPILTGSTDQVADERAIALALALSGGAEGVAAVDSAMNVTRRREVDVRFEASMAAQVNHNSDGIAVVSTAA